MASILVYAHVVNRDVRPHQKPTETIDISDAEVLLLDLGDPYRDTRWSNDRVIQIERNLSERRSNLIQFIRTRVLSQAAKRKWEPWMDAIFIQHCTMSTELALIDRILPAIRRAEDDGTTVWFAGDEPAVSSGSVEPEA